MKLKFGFAIVILASTMGSPSIAESQNPYRWYFGSKVVVDTVNSAPQEKDTPAETVTFTRSGQDFIKRTIVRNLKTWAGPSVGFDVFTRESGTGKYVSGVIPGIGYGIKWGRPNQDPTKDPTALAAIDMFIQGSQSEEDSDHEGSDYFNIDVLPVVTLFNWVSVGYGPRFKTGLDGHPSKTRWLFTFGVKKAP